MSFRLSRKFPDANACRASALLLANALVATGVTAGAAPTAADDEKVVAALDTQYQAAVAKNDAAVMDRILADDFVLVTGRGKVLTKADLLREARSGKMVYERQEDSSQRVRVWGDTAVVTALLWAKGNEDGKPFEYKLWFSDTYVRTPSGWRYVFAQASIRLPSENATAGSDILRSPGCSAPEYHQFDFWAGTWDVYDPDDNDKFIGHSRVDLVLGGCALSQVYEGTNGFIAQALITYDGSRKVWHQSLVSNRGQLLAIDGRLEKDRMILRGTQISAEGQALTRRSVWTPREDGVLETSESSTDGGATWKPVFNILFRRRK